MPPPPRTKPQKWARRHTSKETQRFVLTHVQGNTMWVSPTQTCDQNPGHPRPDDRDEAILHIFSHRLTITQRSPHTTLWRTLPDLPLPAPPRCFSQPGSPHRPRLIPDAVRITTSPPAAQAQHRKEEPQAAQGPLGNVVRAPRKGLWASSQNVQVSPHRRPKETSLCYSPGSVHLRPGQSRTSAAQAFFTSRCGWDLPQPRCTPVASGSCRMTA